ncbi:uncharacterized protein [Branchiostoma lanceolatum]|uniref:uncharacterized protein isoform X1 n=1 Tax=Branchiostoma lanceolatum TaxID=7740 RepID=UPI003455C222
MAEERDRSAAEEEEEAMDYAPVVFQCQRCREILADSLAFIDPLKGPKASVEMGYVSFSAVTESVTIGKDTSSTKKTDKDYGCFYLPLSCSGCGSVIGKMYTSTPREFDALRDAYTININKVTNYSLGSGHSIPQSNQGAIVTAKDMIDNEMSKVRQVVVTLSERVTFLEQVMKEEVEPDLEEHPLPAEKKQVPKAMVPVAKQERSSGTPSRANVNKTSRRPSQNGHWSPVPSRRGRKKARIEVSDDESDN